MREWTSGTVAALCEHVTWRGRSHQTGSGCHSTAGKLWVLCLLRNNHVIVTTEVLTGFSSLHDDVLHLAASGWLRLISIVIMSKCWVRPPPTHTHSIFLWSWSASFSGRWSSICPPAEQLFAFYQSLQQAVRGNTAAVIPTIWIALCVRK